MIKPQPQHLEVAAVRAGALAYAVMLAYLAAMMFR